MAYSSLTVGIVCVYGPQEKIFIDALKRSNGKGVYFEHSENENISPLVVNLALKKYKERKLPILVLISDLFLETVIPSAYKISILKDIIRWDSDYITHVWLGNLKENDVKSYSSALCRTDGNFRKVCESDLPLRTTSWAGSIKDLIIDITPKFSRTNHNLEYHGEFYDDYAEDEYHGIQHQRSLPSMSSDDSDYSMIINTMSIISENEKKSKNEKKSSAKNVAPPVSTQPSVSTPKKAKKKKTKTEDVYSQGANDAYRLVSGKAPAEGSGNVEPAGAGASSSSKQKKKKSKKRTLSSPVRDLTYEQLNKISLLLDIGYGANWKQVAGMFRIDKPTIEHIELALKRNESPSMTLFNLLGAKRPELTLGEFVDACKYIVRQDVVQAIEQDILRSSLTA